MTLDDRQVHQTLRQIHLKHPMPTSTLATQVSCTASQKGRGHEHTVYWLERLLEAMEADEERGFRFCQDRTPVEQILESARSGGWESTFPTNK